jgi:hypothetical protein
MTFSKEYTLDWLLWSRLFDHGDFKRGLQLMGRVHLPD